MDYYVVSSKENWQGDSGWDEEVFGPFNDLPKAEFVAKKHEFDCSVQEPQYHKPKHIVEICLGTIGEDDDWPSGTIIKRTSEKLCD